MHVILLILFTSRTMAAATAGNRILLLYKHSKLVSSVSGKLAGLAGLCFVALFSMTQSCCNLLGAARISTVSPTTTGGFPLPQAEEEVSLLLLDLYDVNHNQNNQHKCLLLNRAKSAPQSRPEVPSRPSQSPSHPPQLQDKDGVVQCPDVDWLPRH